MKFDILKNDIADVNALNLNAYKIFFVVCQTLNYTNTATMLGMKQSNVSYHINRLEDYLGIKLFIRSGKNLIMTPEAESLLPFVVKAINNVIKGENTINDLMNMKVGQIAVGVPSHIGVFLLTDIIKKFNSTYPKIKMKVISKPTKELFRLLDSNELDLVIDCSPLDENIFDFKIVKIAKEKCVLVCNIKDTGLLEKKIGFEDIKKYPLIVPSRTSGNTKELAKVFETYEEVFDPSFEITTSDMIAEMIVKEMGIGYLFEKTLMTYKDLAKIG